MFTFPKKYLSVTDGMSTPVVRGCGASAGVHTCDVCDGEVGAPCFGIEVGECWRWVQCTS